MDRPENLRVENGRLVLQVRLLPPAARALHVPATSCAPRPRVSLTDHASLLLTMQLQAIRGTYTGSAAGCTNNNENSCGWTQPFTSARVRTKLSPSGSWR